ncbi:membrane protein [Allocatelliglobosispora scoriae]|uniref:Membrane protein n=1 Tax=Allocatelliglobosispora scoriae TaxID=643052 RepID=A0A841BRV4_9ACTN|nr:YihY/virulence factor BrkB family protein [Allocatelliglobosispora scoriae]MBB5870435.1 membrane protein [Allocatelliglobosispora scoriae]
MALLRKHSRLFDHFWQAKERYSEVLGARLAAAIAYYGFFAAFALSLIAFGVLIRAVPSIESTLIDFLTEHFPELPFKSFQASTTSLTIFGGIGLILAGLGWVDAWRSSQREIWQLEQHPGNIFIRRIVDLGMLLGLAIVTGVSLVLGDLLTSLFDWISGGAKSIWLTAATSGTTILVNVAFAAALLTVLPRLHISPKRLLPAAVLVGLGISAINWVGRFYVGRTTANPAYAVVATAAGLLVYLYLYNQLVLFGAAIAATSTAGRFVDLAAGPQPDLPDEPQHAEVDSDARARRAEKIRAAGSKFGAGASPAERAKKPRSH